MIPDNMRKLISGALALVAVALFAGAQVAEVKPAVLDANYVALNEWASHLNTLATVWGTHCYKDTHTPECAETKQVLDAAFIFFIKIASGYEPKKGTGCRFELQKRYIAYLVKQAKWNVDCAGRAIPLDSPDATDCGTRNKANDVEGDTLDKEIETCLGDQKL
jgi:hypothetical protein